MRHQIGEGGNLKKRDNKVAGRGITGSEERDPATDPDLYEIDPADFVDPEEFGIRRRFSRDA